MISVIGVRNSCVILVKNAILSKVSSCILRVILVKTISDSDWSYLQATADNRITITTCPADRPSKRVCVQAVEVSS